MKHEDVDQWVDEEEASDQARSTEARPPVKAALVLLMVLPALSWLLGWQGAVDSVLAIA